MNEPQGYYLTVGKYKGEWDFGISGDVYELSYEDMKQLREMTVVAIGQMEAMFSRGQEKRNPAAVHDPSCL